MYIGLMNPMFPLGPIEVAYWEVLVFGGQVRVLSVRRVAQCRRSDTAWRRNGGRVSERCRGEGIGWNQPLGEGWDRQAA